MQGLGILTDCSTARGEQDNLAAALAQNATEIREVKERLKEVEERILEERATGEESLYFKSLLDEKNKLLDKENKLMDEKNKLLDIQKVMLEKSTTARSTDGVEITTATGTFTLHGVVRNVYGCFGARALLHAVDHLILLNVFDLRCAILPLRTDGIETCTMGTHGRGGA